MNKNCVRCKNKASNGVKCQECGKMSCYEHINSGQYSKTRMSNSERVKDVCDECKEKHSYISILGRGQSKLSYKEWERLLNDKV